MRRAWASRCPALRQSPERDRDLGSVDWIKFPCLLFNAAAPCPLHPSAPLLVLGREGEEETSGGSCEEAP
jgi:hypothetical protein